MVTEDTEIEWQWRTEHRLEFIYSGCGAAIPAMTPGDGWYLEDTVITITTENPVYDGPTMYAFDEWLPVGLPTIPPGTSIPSTEFLVLGPYVIEAAYGIGVEITIRKDPADDTLGYFIYDGIDTIWSNDTTMWVVSGSEHSIYTSPVDSTDSCKFVFERWNVGADNPITVAPTASATYIADYTKYWFTLIAKSPAANTYGSITLDATEYSGVSTTGILWIEDLSTIEVSVTGNDIAPDSCDRYLFIEWEDGLDDSTRGLLIDEPTVHTALYDLQYKFVLRKDPLITAGDIIVDGVTYP